jgi:hypothetical protein
VQPYPVFGDPSSTGMSRLEQIHREARVRDGEDPSAYAAVQYVYGYVAVAAWRAAVESSLDAGEHVDADSLTRSFERFQERSIDGLVTISYSATDHRPQSNARVYVVAPAGPGGAGQGRLDPVGQPLGIALQPDWLGW